MMFGLQRKSSKENSPRPSVSQTPFKYSLNNFDEFVSVQEKRNRRCKEQIKTTRDVTDLKRRLLQFDVHEFCYNFEKEMLKTLMDVSKIHKKSTSTRAPVAEPSLFISKTPKGTSEKNFEDLKDFSDSLPIYDEYDEDLLESLIICEDECDLPSPKSDLMFDDEVTNGLTCFEPEYPSSLVLVSQVFKDEQFNYPHQGRLLGTRRPMDVDLCSIFDEEEDHLDELGPTFEEKAPSITSINMENHLCFDPGRTPTPLSPNPQEHCKELSIISSMPDLFVKISCSDIKHFGLEKVKEFCVSNSVFDNMIHSFKKT